MVLSGGTEDRCHPPPDINHVKNVTREADSIPLHPLGIKPLGNQYLFSGTNARLAAGVFRLLPDEALMVFLEYLDKESLRLLGYTCKFLGAFCLFDDLWKTLYLGSSRNKDTTVEWRGSWRSTLLQLDGSHAYSFQCNNVFSDVLHRPFVCSHLDLSRFTTDIPSANQIRRFTNLSYTEFADNWAQKPFILTECIQSWPAYQDWNLDFFVKNHAHTIFRAESVDWTFGSYNQYMRTSSDESPLYLFDKKFAETMQISVEQGPSAAYWKPECFGPDLFELLAEDRPAHRWLIIGPERSGSTFHKDPNGTSAWNAVIQGSKYWIMFPPQATVPGVYVSEDSSEVTSPLSIAEWLLEFHREARRLPECIEGICKKGEILHVPSGWWHLVVNLEPGIAITQNFVPKTPSLHNLSEVLSFLRDKPEQVSGFRGDVVDPYHLFCQRLEQTYASEVEAAVELLQRRQENGKKRKWESLVRESKEESEGGFSFGFGVDESEEEEEEDTE